MTPPGETPTPTPSARLLHGLRVVEVGRAIAAPLAGMMLAEQGAEVVRVAPRGASDDEPVLAALLARGKLEVPLDLERPEERATLRRLLLQADVVLENLPPGGRRRAGLDWDELREANPGLVSCSLPGFPADDPRSALPGYEAVTGLYGFLYDKPLGIPGYHGLPVGSVMAGLHGAAGVVAALIARLELGRGQHVETSVYHASLFAQVLPILVKTGVPRGFLPLKMVGTPFMSSWPCRDGRYLYLHITLPAHNARILELLEANGHAADVRRLRGILSAETMRDPSQVKSIPEAKAIRRAYEAVFRTRTADEWERLLGQELCCIKVRTAAEWVDDSLQAGMTDVCRIDDPLLGALKAPGPVVVVADAPPRLEARRRGDALGADTLARWEADPRPTAAPPPATAPRPPLAGYRVVDLSRVIAGPCAARVLAELGAEVVSVQNPTGLDWALSFHLIFNAGKKSVTLDFTKDEGKRKLWALLEEIRPHAFIQNYRHLDVARAVGVDPDAVRARFPGVVYTHLNAYGNEGGWRDRPGFEQVVQAVTGIQLAYGRGGKPKLLPTPIIDIGSGLAGAFATLLGLYHRQRTGAGAFVATHLTSTAVLFQVDAIAAAQRAECQARVGAPAAWDAGRDVVATVARALDDFVLLAGPRADVRRWLRHAGLDDAPPADGDPFARVTGKLWRRPVAWWRRSLAAAGVERTVVVLPTPSLRTLIRDLARVDRSPIPLVRKRRYPGCPAELTFVRHPLRLSLTPIADVAPPPARGADTREVLARIGVQLPPGAGAVPYPENKPLLEWLASFVRWGYFAWRSGNV